MKQSKTTIKELTKRYRTVLLKCALINMAAFTFIFPANAAPIGEYLSDHPTKDGHKVLSIAANAEVTGNFGGWTDGGNHMVNGTGMYQGQIGESENRLNVSFNAVGLYFSADRMIGAAGDTLGILNISNTNFSMEDSVITGGVFMIRQVDNVNVAEGPKVNISNSAVYLKDSGIESKGDLEIRNSSLTYSCQDCYEEDGDVGDYMLLGHNVTIDGSTVVLGDTERQQDVGEPEEAFFSSTHNLNINNSSLELNGKSVLAYEGEMEIDEFAEAGIITNGVGSISINNSTLTFNDQSSLRVGMDEDDEGNPQNSQASLMIKDSTVNLKDSSSIEFSLENNETTTIDHSTINMSGNSELQLKDMVLQNNSKIDMQNHASVVADEVVLKDSYITMKNDTTLDVYNVVFNGGVIYSSDNAKVYIKNDKGANSITLNGTTITSSLLSNSISNIIKFIGTVQFSGLFDPATAEVDGTLNRGGYDDEITYNLNAGGKLAYVADKFLYDTAKHPDVYGLNSINFKGGTLSLANNEANAVVLQSIQLTNVSTLSLDVDLENGIMDSLNTNNVSGNALLNITDLKILSDTDEDDISVNFTSTASLMNKIAYTGREYLTGASSLYRYKVEYDSETGNFYFKRSNGYGPQLIEDLKDNNISVSANEQNAIAALDDEVIEKLSPAAQVVVQKVNDLLETAAAAGNTAQMKQILREVAPEAAPSASSTASSNAGAVMNVVSTRMGGGSPAPAVGSGSSSRSAAPAARSSAGSSASSSARSSSGTSAASSAKGGGAAGTSAKSGGGSKGGAATSGSKGGSKGGAKTSARRGRSGGDYTAGAVSVWAQGMYNKADLHKADGFDSDSAGFAAGFEFSINEAVKAGIGYAYSDTDIESDRSKTDVDTHTGFIYGEYKPNNFYVNGTLSYGHSKYDEKTKLAGLKSEYRANTFAGQLMSGYTFGFLTPEAGLRYTSVRQRSYKNALGARMASQTLDTWTWVGGLKAAKSFRLNKKAMITPDAKVMATYDFRRDGQARMVTLANGSSYVADGESMKRFGVEVGAGVSATFGKTDIGLSYEGKFKDHYTDHTGMINVKYNF